MSLTAGRIGCGGSYGAGTEEAGWGGATSKDRRRPWVRRRSGIGSANAGSRAAAPTVALGSRPTRNSISRKSATRARHASKRRRWSRAHSRSFPSSRSSSTALGEMRVQRFRSKFDVVINLPQLRAAAVERVHQLTGRHIDHVGELVVREFHEIPQQYHRARVEGEGRQGALHRVAPQGAARLRLREVHQGDLGGALAPKPAARSQHRTTELGGGTKNSRPLESLVTRTLAQPIGNLPTRPAGEGRA